ncbi:MAG: YbaK/EbsC family protein [Treponema sp.]|nr:YbaK/EbsC family protein [Treponema sp.]
MSVEKVKAYFKQFGIAERVLELSQSSATVEEAAHALHTDSCRIAKTLSFDVDGRTVLVVASGDVRIDNSKYKAEFGKKAAMILPAELAMRVGHEAGGVCPFALPENVEVYLDVSLKRFETVFPACGSSNSTIELTISELELYAKPRKWIDIGKLT